MGQYYTIINKTKKEYVDPHALCSGAKLLEFGQDIAAQGLCLLLANSNGRGGGDLRVHDREAIGANLKQIAIDGVAGRWAGDRIVIQGDYHEAGDPGRITDKAFESYTNISHLVLKALSVDQYLAEQINKDQAMHG